MYATLSSLEEDFDKKCKKGILLHSAATSSVVYMLSMYKILWSIPENFWNPEKICDGGLKELLSIRLDRILAQWTKLKHGSCLP